MFGTIVIGMDGKAGGQDALALARLLAEPDSRLIAVHAFPYEINPSRASLAGYENELREDAERDLCEWVADPEIERRVVADTSPARALRFVAEETGAELIVVGSSHRGGIGRVLLGDVSRSVVHGSHCAVAVAPRDHSRQERPVRTVGTGYTDGAAAGAAFEAAIALARRFEAQLRVLTAITCPRPLMASDAYAINWPAFRNEYEAGARAELAGATAGLDVPVICDVVEDLPGHALVSLSQVADVMVVGSRGWGALRSIVVGSAGDRLMHHSHCPVILVPSPDHSDSTASSTTETATSAITSAVAAEPR